MTTKSISKLFSTKEIVLLLILLATIIGLYYSIFVLSLAPFLMLALALSDKISRQRISRFFKQPKVFGICLILLLYILSGLNSSNTNQWLSRVNTNLPYFFIPFALYLLTPFRKQIVNAFLALFVLVNTAISLYLMIGYFIDFEAINTAYAQGRTIATPIIHVRYSYFTALAILSAAYLILTKQIVVFRWERWLYGGCLLFLFAFLHLLAVRTGLLALYLTIILYGAYLVLRFKKYKEGAAAFAAMVIFVLIAINVFPTIKAKLAYVKWDIQSTLNNTSNHHNSDRIRINSILYGLDIVKKQPLFGVGIGDLEEEVSKRYAQHYPDLPLDQRFTPINQFVFTLAAFGILGFILFYLFLSFPLIFFHQRHYLIIPFYLLTFATFIGETSIELIIGKTGFLLFIGILMFAEVDKESVTA